ncbi:MAG: APC family permease [Bryobacteraceae bacterium]
MPDTEKTLRAGAMGTLGVAALGAVMMAPALGIYANLGLIGAEGGRVAPAVFLLALLCTLPTAVSYALISREIPSAGSAYTWLSDSLTPEIGMWIGSLAAAMYFFAVILQPILFGLFFNDLLSSVFGVTVGYGTWLLGVLLSTVVVALLAYPGVQISAKGSIVLMVCELTVVLALAGTILLVLLPKGQVNFTPFNPLRALHGRHGLFAGLVFALLTFVGFGVITTAAEETHSPRETIPKVLILACVLLGLFWAVTAWPFSLALPEGDWAVQVAKGINPVAVAARQYWKSLSIIVTLTALSAVLGVYLASIVGYARIVFAMGRDGTLPNWFARLHPKYQVPWNAQHVVLAVTVLADAVWAKWLGIYLSYDWWGTAVVFFAMISNVFVNVGCTVYFFRFRRESFHWLWHVAVPMLGVVTSALPLYYSFGPDLWRAGWQKGQSVIVFCLAVTVLSVIYTAGLRKWRPEVLKRGVVTAVK